MDIENLIFEGGGVHGIAYLGALRELNELNLLQSVRRCAGTSIGALIATAVALRIPIDEVIADFATMTHRQILPNQCFIVTIKNVIKRWGMYDPNGGFRKWLVAWLVKHEWKPDVTLDEVVQKTHIDLFIAVYDRTRCRGEVLSRHNNPNAPLVDVLLAAMAIPPVFIPVKIRGSNNLIIDGGMTNNFPMYIFDSEEYGGTGSYNERTLGFRSTVDQSLYFAEDIGYTPAPPSNVIDYLMGIVEVIMESGQQRHEREKDADRTCFILVPRRISSIDFDVSDEDRELLFNLGRASITRDMIDKFS